MPRHNAKRFKWVCYIKLLEQVCYCIRLDLSIRDNNQVLVLLFLVLFGVVINESVEADVPFQNKLVKTLFEKIRRIIADR